MWPSVTLAAVYFYRIPTKVYETVKNSLSPVLVSFGYERDRWNLGELFQCRLWVVDDLVKTSQGTKLNWVLSDPKGRMVARDEQTIEVDTDSVLEVKPVAAHPDSEGR